MSGYIELHARSAFSFLRGASQPWELAEAGAARGLAAMAVCDRGGFYGSARFHREMKDAGMRAIVGCELPMEDGSALPVLVKSRQGYRNACRLLTRSCMAAAKGEGRVAWSALPEFSEGLIALSGDEEGPLARAWQAGDRSGVAAAAQRLTDCFGRENVCLEVQRRRERGEERWARALRDLAEATGLPLLATNGALYARPDGRATLDVFTCLREKTTLDAAGGLLSRNGQRFVKGPEEMADLFRDMPEAVSNTLRVAERLEFSLENLGYEFPSFPVPDGHSMDSYLREVVWSGARRRYGSPSAKARKQLRHELAVIEKLGFSGYFLIVWDLVKYCREHGIMAQGRGSSANSAVCFCLDITPFDPVGHGLLFERFLNEERAAWPDIDIDLPSGDRREQVIQEVYRRYGRSGSAMTANVITYRRRSAIREVGKVLGFSEETLSRFSSMYGSSHYTPEGNLEEQLRASGVEKGHPRSRVLQALYQRVIGLPRHLGQHSGGMVICEGELDSVVPLEPASMPGRSVTQWDKDDCEDMGIVKVDLLGLGMMAALQDSMESLQGKGVKIDLGSIPKDDAATYRMMQEADTIGVFQIESRAQMATLPRMKPKTFYDVVIEVGIIRPGPIQGKMVHPYLERRAGRQEIEYIDESLKPVLERTLGVALFQEQILQVAMVMAGFSGAKAERLRRIVSSFGKDERRTNRVMEDLISSMRERGVAPEKIESVIQSVSSFAHYGFPESHSISFGWLAYVSTYLKANYAEEFYAALLNNQPMGFYSSATLIQDAKRHGIRVRPVCVRDSAWLSVAPERGELRLGLRMVEGLNKERALEMIEARERKAFASMGDFRARSRFAKDELRQLASIGALNCLAGDRRSALWEVEAMLEQGDLFAGLEEPEATLSPLEVMTHLERLQADYRGTGVTVGGHPMRSVRARLPNVWRSSDLANTPDGARVKLAGQAICRQRPGTAKGFVFISLEDETGIANVVVTPPFFERFRLTITEERFMLVSGRLQNREGVIHVKAEKIEALRLKELPASSSHDFH